MSRTYRYDPEAGCGRGGKSEARRRDAERAASEAEPMPAAEGAFHGEGAFPGGSGRAGEAEMAEAVGMMRPRVEHLVWAMERDGVICRSEREDYVSILNCHICRVLPLYDREHVGRSGMKAELCRYLTVCVDSAAANVRRYLSRSRRRATLVPVSASEPGAGSARAWWGGDLFGDRGRSAAHMVFCMDVDTLFGMLGEAERLALALRIEGMTFPEIADELSVVYGRRVTRFHVMNTLFPRIAKAARKCGFVPAGELRREGR